MFKGPLVDRGGGSPGPLWARVSSWGSSVLDLRDHDLRPTSPARIPGSKQPGSLPRSPTRRGSQAGPGPRLLASTARVPLLWLTLPSFPFLSFPFPTALPAPAASAQAHKRRTSRAAERRAHARQEPVAEGSAPCGCRSAIQGFGPAGGSVYKHTARSPVRGNPKGSGVGGRESSGTPAGKPVPSLSRAADCAAWPTQMSYRGPGLPGRHVVRTWSGPARQPPLPHSVTGPQRPLAVPGAPRCTSRLRLKRHDASSGLSGIRAWIGCVLVTAARQPGPGF